MAKIILTNHAKERLLDRDIDIIQVRKIIKKPLKTENGLDGKIIITGILEDKRVLKVVYKKLKGKIIIITAYYEN